MKSQSVTGEIRKICKLLTFFGKDGKYMDESVIDNNNNTQAAVASILNPGRNAYIGLNDIRNEVGFQEKIRFQKLITGCLSLERWVIRELLQLETSSSLQPGTFRRAQPSDSRSTRLHCYTFSSRWSSQLP